MFKTEIIRLGSQTLRVGRHAGGSGGIPLLYRPRHIAALAAALLGN